MFALALGPVSPSSLVLGHGGISGWVIDVIDSIGEVGVAVLILLENLFPPIPSELILPLAGYRAHAGQMNLALVWVAATLGSLTGALILYGMGALISYDRLHDLAGRGWFVVLNQHDLERGKHFFTAHGTKVVLVGRCVPIVRSIVSIPAGLVRMPMSRFVAYTLIGSGIWNAAFIGAGWELDENYHRVQRWIRPASYAVLFLVFVGIGIATTRKLRSRT